MSCGAGDQYDYTILPSTPERGRNLLFCDVSGRRVLRLNREKNFSRVIRLDDLSPGGLAAQKAGCIFLTTGNLAKATGSIVAVNPDGTDCKTLP